MNYEHMTIDELISVAEAGDEKAFYEIGKKVVDGSTLGRAFVVECPECNCEFEVKL